MPRTNPYPLASNLRSHPLHQESSLLPSVVIQSLRYPPTPPITGNLQTGQVQPYC
nr:hypothetical protein Q903MT_gene2110 [Picea sitchensis]